MACQTAYGIAIGKVHLVHPVKMGFPALLLLTAEIGANCVTGALAQFDVPQQPRLRQAGCGQ
jgi:hypothetical protein